MITDTDLPAGRHWALMAKHYYGALSKKLEDMELDRHYSVLILIHRLKGKCSQQFLANSLSIDKVYMVRILDELSRKGYVERTVNPDDRREHFIGLTVKGRADIPRILRSVKQLNEAMFKGIGEKDREKFLVILNTVWDNLQAMPAARVTLNYKRGK